MMASLVMIAGVVVLGGLTVMACRMLVVFSCLVVMLRGCFRHTPIQFCRNAFLRYRDARGLQSAR